MYKYTNFPLLAILAVVVMFICYPAVSQAQPPNDLCQNSLPIFNGDTAFSNVGAGRDGTLFTPCDRFGADIWYIYTATCTGDVTYSTCNQANYDTMLAVNNSTDCNEVVFSDQSLLACNDFFVGCGNSTSQLTVPVVNGQGYIVRVGGFGGFTGFAQGQGTLSIIPESNCIAPNLLDIKPGSCPNSFNRESKGVLPVALVGTDTFDVSQVDIDSLELGRADGVGGSVQPNEGPPGPHSVIEDVATPFDGELCECHDLDGDGIDDLSMKFRSQDLVEALELDSLPGGGLVELCLTGTLLDGTPFEACDCIRLVPPN